VAEISYGDGRGWWWISQRLEPKLGEEREGVGARLIIAKWRKEGGTRCHARLSEGRGPAPIAVGPDGSRQRSGDRRGHVVVGV
jgi:hypothetical protein